jgi:quinol monooxygenase YgiN
MVHASIRMEMSPSNAREALDILGPLAERTRVEPGCFSCRIYRDVQHEDTIMFEELWSGQEELRRHLCSPEYQRVLLVVEMAKGQPEIRFSTISHASGFETIAEARSFVGSTPGAA